MQTRCEHNPMNACMRACGVLEQFKVKHKRLQLKVRIRCSILVTHLLIHLMCTLLPGVLLICSQFSVNFPPLLSCTQHQQIVCDIGSSSEETLSVCINSGVLNRFFQECKGKIKELLNYDLLNSSNCKQRSTPIMNG